MDSINGELNTNRKLIGNIKYPGSGDSAYQVAVNNGFVGSEEAWLDSLKGEPGESYVLTNTDKQEIADLVESEVGNGITKETDPTVPQHIKNITEQDIEKWNNVDELENVLQDILEAIQNGGTTSMTIEEIERLIVSYFETKTVEEVEGE